MGNPRNPQVARDVAKQDLEAAHLSKHEALSEEMRRAHERQTEESRQWAQTLVERLSNDLRGAQWIPGKWMIFCGKWIQ